MTSQDDYWKYIRTYKEVIKIGTETYRKVIFDLYVSRDGQLGWTNYGPKRDYKRPLKGIKADSATRLDISQMLSWIAKNELKMPVHKSLNMLLDNEDTVIKIERDLTLYKILSK